MARRNSVQRAFDAFGNAHFQTKESGWWRRRTGDVEQRLNLQKSQYSLSYYVNVELAFPGLAGDCAEIHGRAGDFLSSADQERLDQLLDIEGYGMEEEHREHELLALMDALSPALDDLSTVERLTDAFREGRFNAMGVTRQALAVFGAR